MSARRPTRSRRDRGDTASSSSRSRTRSPVDGSGEYCITRLRYANIFVDNAGEQDLPPEIEARLPHGLRDILSPLSAACNHCEVDVTADKQNNQENDTRAREVLLDKASSLAVVYRKECGVLARRVGGETEYRTHLYVNVVEQIARASPCDSIISTLCSESLGTPCSNHSFRVRSS